MVRVRGINGDTADESRRAICIERIEPVYVTLVFVVSAFLEIRLVPALLLPIMSQYQKCRARPLPRFRRNALFHGSLRRGRQFCRASGPDPNEITASRVRTRGRKLRTVGFEECLVASPILGSPDTQRSLEIVPALTGSAMMGA